MEDYLSFYLVLIVFYLRSLAPRDVSIHHSLSAAFSLSLVARPPDSKPHGEKERENLWIARSDLNP